MIVKNEHRVIERCLRSVQPFIDHWVIADTGSSDGTQQLIRDYLSAIPGRLVEHLWINFEHNRNLALDCALNCADYLLFIDADEELHFSGSFQLDRDCLFIPVHIRSNVFQRPFLVNSAIGWRWKGAIHERIESPAPFTSGYSLNAHLLANEDGDRSRDLTAKFLQDAQILEDLIKKDPTNGRLVLLLAQTFGAAGQLELALKYYGKRAAMGGGGEEVFYALYAMAQYERMLNLPCIDTFFRAYRFRPTRAEPLAWIAAYYLENGQLEKAYAILKKAILIPYPNDMINVEPKIYDYFLLAQLADTAWKLQKFDEAKNLFSKLLANPKVPEDLRRTIQSLEISK